MLCLDSIEIINITQVKSELPSTFQAYRHQQHRWTCGAANLFRKMAWEIITNKVCLLEPLPKRQKFVLLSCNTIIIYVWCRRYQCGRNIIFCTVFSSYGEPLLPSWLSCSTVLSSHCLPWFLKSLFLCGAWSIFPQPLLLWMPSEIQGNAWLFPTSTASYVLSYCRLI